MDSGHDNLVLNLKRLARRRRCSMNRLADAAGVARGALSDILAKRQSPTLTTLQKLADALEVPVGNLLLPPVEEHGRFPAQRLDLHGHNSTK